MKALRVSWLITACLFLRISSQSQVTVTSNTPSYAATTLWIGSHFVYLHGKTALDSTSYEFISMNGCKLTYREKESETSMGDPAKTTLWSVPLADLDRVEVSPQHPGWMTLSTFKHGPKVSFQIQFMEEPDFQDHTDIIANGDEASIDLIPRMQKAVARAAYICRIEADKAKKPKSNTDGPF